MIGSRSAYTRKQILDAAGRLFAKKGHDNTSLREITSAARVNLSSVNYHFGSKEGLIQAVYQQQLDSLNHERLSMLDRFEAQAGGAALTPAQIVEAFFRPLVRHAVGHAVGKKPFMPLLEHGTSDPNSFIRTLIMSGHSDIVERFCAALTRALPDVPEVEIFWRFQFMLGAASCAISGMDGLLLALNRANTESFDVERLCRRLLVFLIGGLMAPLPDAENTPAGRHASTGLAVHAALRGRQDSSPQRLG